jgi:Cu/Ag efflux pump CusA
MLRWIVGASLHFRAIILAAATAILLFSIVRLRDAPVDVLPEFAAPIVEIQTEALGLSATEVEELITLNLEELLAGTPWLRTIRSKSLEGVSSVLLVFEPGTDIWRARQMVHERLIMAHALPNVSKPPNMLQPLSTTNRTMIVGLTPKNVSMLDLSVLARWTITPKLLGVPGVANVAIWGMRPRQLQVQVDPERLRDHNVTLDQVIETTGDAMWVSPLSFLEASTPGAGGWIDGPNQRLGIQHVQPITSPDALAKVTIEGRSLNLGDVAKISEEHPPLIGDALINNDPGLLVVIEKFPHADPVQVAQGVDAALNELRQGLSGIVIDSSIFRGTNFIESATENFAIALFIGVIMAALVVSILLFEWRAALISVVAIAMSLACAWLLLYLRQATIDMMSLAGLVLALTIIIDDVVIEVSNIMRRLRQNQRDVESKSMGEVILESCLEIRSPMIYATLIIILAAAPVFFVGGQLGALFSPLVTSYLLALLASMLVAITVTPALALTLLRNASLEHRELSLMQGLQHRYESLLSRSVATPRLMLLGAGVSAVIGLALLPLLSWSLLPPFKERDVQISMKAPLGTSHPAMQRIMTQAGKELQQIPGIRFVAAHIGRAITGDQIVGMESGQIWVSIDSSADYDATLTSVRDTVQGYPGIDGEVQTCLTDTVQQVLPPANSSIAVRVEGPVRETLRSEAEKVRQILSDIPGTVNSRLEDRSDAPHVEIKVDLAAAGRVGLKPGDVRRAIATVFAGLEVGHLFEQQKIFEVVVWGVPEVRRNLTDVRDLLIPTGNGHVRLADVADVRVVGTPNVIEREGVSRRVYVRADVAGRSVEAVAAEVNNRLQKATFPLEYHAVLLRDYAERQATRWDAFFISLATAAGIYLLLQACFQSWRLAALFCLILLASLTGSVLAMLATGGTVFLSSLAGILAMLGIAARTGILLINRFQHPGPHGEAALGPELVLRGAGEWFRPIMASMIAMAVALLPMAVSGDLAGLEIVHPMAVSVLGGLVTTAVMILFVLPALYLPNAALRPETHPYGSEQHAT